MYKLRPLVCALSGVAVAAALASGANAGTITWGLSTGGPITTEATGGNNLVAGPVSFGTFTVNSVIATGDGALPFGDLLNTASINTSSSAAGVIDVWITIQGLTAPVGTLLSFVSSFT